jgi:predicted regulator of Ras-like GTPase activity (Roadblock/LC7/MglB family)
MKNGLKEINKTVGVWGSLLCDNQGRIIEEVTPPALNKPRMENISRHILETINTMGEELTRMEEVVLHYKQRKLFAVDIQQALLIVVCTPSVDIPLLRMSVNVIVTGWQNDPKVKKELAKAFIERI